MPAARRLNCRGQVATIVLTIIAGMAIGTIVILLFMRQSPTPAAVGESPQVVKTAATPVTPAQPAPAPQDADPPPPTQEETDQAMGAWIDETAGHPDDPMLPIDELGASDKVLAAADPGEIADLLRQSKDWIKTPAAQPRHLFALGRAAIAHGYDRMGNDLLQRAADAGSIAAVAYQGYAAFDAGRTDVAKQKLEQAKKAGFKSQALDDALAAVNKTPESTADANGDTPTVKPEPFKASDFNQPAMIQALYDGDFDKLDQTKLFSLTYISHVNEGAIDKSLYLGMNLHIHREFDKTLATRIGQITQGKQDVMVDNFNVQLQTFLTQLQGVSKALDKNGGTAIDRVGAIGQAGAYNAQMDLQLIGDQGDQDGTILATLYEYDRAAFRKIYANMRTYVSHQHPAPQK